MSRSFPFFHHVRAVGGTCVFLSLFGAVSRAEPQDLKRMSIEELMQVDVTIATRQAEPIGRTAAAVAIITGDDIHRAGVTTLADALRLADGLQVARIDNDSWAITARGFNQGTANKLLVMVDGLTVYSPLFAGVFWNTLDYVLDDIDRIEVVRGPGGTLWGANAVNGVVNIITKRATDTQGAYAHVSAGTEDRAITELRYGGTHGAVAWRAYGKFADREAQVLGNGAGAGDGRRRGQAGVRLDGGTTDGDNWLLKADAFHSADDFAERGTGEFTDLSAQVRVSRTVGASRVTIQSYFRHEYRRVPEQLTHRLETIDVDAQQNLRTSRHDIVWGGGVRRNSDETDGSAILSFVPDARVYAVSNVFAQDEIAVVPNRLFVTGGVKYEHNAFSGGELQPNVRGRVMLPHAQMAWAAVSRAVRRPTRFEDDLLISVDGAPALVGTDDFVPESLIATEAGYRAQPARALSLDVTLFDHEIDHLRSVERLPSGLPFVWGNSLHGRSRGVETAVNVQPRPWWRTHVGYTWLDTTITRRDGSFDISNGVSEANDPHHLFNLRTSIDIAGQVELDGTLRRVGALPNPAVPGYTELQLRAGWHVTHGVELSIAGEDLLHDDHREFGEDSPLTEVLQRSVRAGISFTF